MRAWAFVIVAACGGDASGPMYEERVPIGSPEERIDDADDPAEVDGEAYDGDGLGAVPAFANPVGPACADPGAIVVEGTAWVACTGEGFPLLSSSDLVHWEAAGQILDERPAWASDDFWAPEIHRIGEGFVAYYTARATDRDETCIGAARADSMAGPWRDLGRPLICDAHVGIIDVHVFTDDDASNLYYKTEGNALVPPEPTVIVGQELGADGVTIVGERQALISNTSDWEGDVVEAPWVMKRGGYYYLFFSGFRYCDDTYGVGIARARSPLGPFAKRSDPMLASDEAFTGPGHNSIVAADGQAWLVYHAWEGAHSCDDEGERVLMIDPVTWRGGWPRID